MYKIAAAENLQATEIFSSLETYANLKGCDLNKLLNQIF